MKKITLDNQAHPTLLVALWKLEETIEAGKMKKAKKKLTELIEMVRYSDAPFSEASEDEEDYTEFYAAYGR